MADLDDVRRLARELPGVSETTSYGQVAWAVAGKAFVWERPFSGADRRRFGDRPVPAGTILAARVADLDAKDAALTADPDVLLTIEHLHGYPIVLARLDEIDPVRLEELVGDAWLACAPAALVRDQAARPGPGPDPDDR
ncbi:MmcQ/YjbR family DNA-binding protein [Auraticoccus monumenti]|uniref:YjbR protein n=1 Tax=Auraticoccus monumenti TaxID=675864 RepID=A0A1G7AH78_9ACTN|nr:hypothetical protein [Auraticoccus monumenti]SDE14294.1 hypothetical protein SAMN04489747_2620 [Auraticoccus monumenti]